MLKLLLTTALLATTIANPLAARAQEALKKPPRGKVVVPRANGTPYADREDAMAFADDLAQRRDMDPAWIRRAIAEARLVPTIARLMQPAPAGTPKNWRVYRSRFIDPVRIAAGVKFWQANRESLQRAEKEFGVPAEIIVGIIGVETIYGQQMGTFRVIDALSTLAFDFPASHPRAQERSAYFRGELEQFLTLQSRLGNDPLEPLGSFAGAMGMPQFMPSSRSKWALDYDGDSKVDLAGSAADAIGSVANYFRGFGWKPGLPSHYPVTLNAGRLDKDALLAPDILPTFSVASFAARGAVLPPEAQQHPGQLALVELQNGADEPTYVAGTENFYVITRYNQSSYYAMAVIELGREVKTALDRN